MVSDACWCGADMGARSGARAAAFFVMYVELEQELEWGGAHCVSYCSVMLLYDVRTEED